MMSFDIAKDQARLWAEELSQAAGRTLGSDISILEAGDDWDDQEYPWLCQSHCITDDGIVARWAE